MGLVLAFQSTPRPASRAPQRRVSEPARSADILFFTGVRYERHDDVNSANHRPDATPNGSAPRS